MHDLELGPNVHWVDGLDIGDTHDCQHGHQLQLPCCASDPIVRMLCFQSYPQKVLVSTWHLGDCELLDDIGIHHTCFLRQCISNVLYIPDEVIAWLSMNRN